MHDRATSIGYRVAQLGALATALGGAFDALVPTLLRHHEVYLGVAPDGALVVWRWPCLSAVNDIVS